MKNKINIGTSGYSYAYWHEPDGFYPKTTESDLQYYAQHFNFVEINNSFYKEPSVTTFKKWKKSVSKDFVFVIKVNRYFTHFKRLNIDDTFNLRWKSFWTKCKTLKPKLGAILFQLPPIQCTDGMINKLKMLHGLLPKRHKIIFEFRHHSWENDQILKLFKKYNWCFCVININNDTGWADDIKSGFFPKNEVFWTTAKWGCYFRFHGNEGPYYGNYDKRTLKQVAKKMMGLHKKGLCSFAAFNNTDDATPSSAIVNAQELQNICRETIAT